MVCVRVLVLLADDGTAVEDSQSERADHEDGRTHIFHRVCQLEAKSSAPPSKPSGMATAVSFVMLNTSCAALVK